MRETSSGRTIPLLLLGGFVASVACTAVSHPPVGTGDPNPPREDGGPAAETGAPGGSDPDAGMVGGDGGSSDDGAVVGSVDAGTGADGAPPTPFTGDVTGCNVASGDALFLTDPGGGGGHVTTNLTLENGVDSAGFKDTMGHTISFEAMPKPDGTFGDPLAVADYPNASALGSTHPILKFGNCNQVTGHFRVTAVKRYGALITQFVAAFQLSCEGVMPAITGCVRYDHATSATNETYTASRVFGGGTQFCALTSAGEVRCWGNGTNVPTLVAGLPAGVASVALGSGHGCSLTTQGRVDCWGDNTSGQLGNGDLTVKKSATPLPVVGLSSGVVSIAAGDSHTCAVQTSGAVVCWGAAVNGQLGQSYSTPNVAPVALTPAPLNVTALSAANNTSCVVADGGHVLCWGANDKGQLGNGMTGSSGGPTEIVGLTTASAVAVGYFHTCALLADGTAQCWGGNVAGSLGDGTTTDRATPAAVTGLTGVAQIGSGDVFSCALLTGGSAKCWGHDASGELGIGTTGFDATTASAVVGLAGSTGIASGASSTCALIAGKVTCWGDNDFDELGDGLVLQNVRNRPLFNVATFP